MIAVWSRGKWLHVTGEERDRARDVTQLVLYVRGKTTALAIASLIRVIVRPMRDGLSFAPALWRDGGTSDVDGEADVDGTGIAGDSVGTTRFCGAFAIGTRLRRRFRDLDSSGR